MQGTDGSEEQSFTDDDLAAVGAPGAPSAFVVSLDPESVMDLRVVPLAEQARILQAGLTAIGPMQEMMDVAPPGRRFAAGEHAGLVAESTARWRWGGTTR